MSRPRPRAGTNCRRRAVDSGGQVVNLSAATTVPAATLAAAEPRAAYRPALTAAQVEHRPEATADHSAAALPGLGRGTVHPVAALTTLLPEEKVAGPPVTVSPPAGRCGHRTNSARC
ncbi:hypothetical protein [Nocardia carnea]|uniref:hypothetical protein n=1 Tax=Nocardia carnea TaxID=37328 RepID=UPI0024548665|nr:hypothetical protein [Nocardia carnea]